MELQPGPGDILVLLVCELGVEKEGGHPVVGHLLPPASGAFLILGNLSSSSVPHLITTPGVTEYILYIQ